LTAAARISASVTLVPPSFNSGWRITHPVEVVFKGRGPALEAQLGPGGDQHFERRGILPAVLEELRGIAEVEGLLDGVLAVDVGKRAFEHEGRLELAAGALFLLAGRPFAQHAHLDLLVVGPDAVEPGVEIQGLGAQGGWHEWVE
jgi:hypothetical protein